MGRKKKNKESKVLPIKPEIRTLANCATNFKLTIPDDIYQKIMYWLKKTTNEVSGFGSLEWDAQAATYTVKDVILLKQEVGRTSTEIDPVSLGKAMFQMKDEPMGLKWHWHTHPNMGVFWSGDDMEIIRSLGQQGWIIATVFNDKGEHKSAFYTKTQVMGTDHDIFRDDLPTEVVRFLPRTFFQALDEEYDKCVSLVPKWIGPGVNTKVYGGPVVGVEGYDGYGEDYERPIHSLDASRWAKPLEYTTFGYAQVDTYFWVYNPIYDETLVTEENELDAIGEMDTKEIEYCKTHDQDFQQLYAKYLAREIKLAEATLDSEAASWNT